MTRIVSNSGKRNGKPFRINAGADKFYGILQLLLSFVSATLAALGAEGLQTALDVAPSAPDSLLLMDICGIPNSSSSERIRIRARSTANRETAGPPDSEWPKIHSERHFRESRVFRQVTEQCCEADFWLPIGVDGFRAWGSRPSRRPAPVLACRHTPGCSSVCHFER